MIKTPDIGDKQVTERKLADGSVTSSKLSTEIANMLSLLTTRISSFKVADNLSSLPTEENTIGWLVDNHLYVYVGNGSTPESGMYQDCGELRGPQGIQGEQGLSGLNGKSAYDIWTEQPGNEDKSEIDFLEFIKGSKGDKGDQGEIGPQGNSGIADASNKTLVNDAITGGETDFLSAEVGKLGILTYDCSKGGTVTHTTLLDAINSVPTTFQKVGLTITYKSGDTIYRYTLKANAWSADPANWFSVEDKLSDLSKVSHLPIVEKGEVIEIIQNHYIPSSATDTVVENINFSYSRANLKKGDVVEITNKGGYTPLAYMLLDSKKNIVCKANQNSDYQTYKLIAPCDGEIIINYNKENEYRQQIAILYNKRISNEYLNSIIDEDLFENHYEYAKDYSIKDINGKVSELTIIDKPSNYFLQIPVKDNDHFVLNGTFKMLSMDEKGNSTMRVYNGNYKNLHIESNTNGNMYISFSSFPEIHRVQNLDVEFEQTLSITKETSLDHFFNVTFKQGDFLLLKTKTGRVKRITLSLTNEVINLIPISEKENEYIFLMPKNGYGVTLGLYYNDNDLTFPFNETISCCVFQKKYTGITLSGNVSQNDFSKKNANFIISNIVTLTEDIQLEEGCKFTFMPNSYIELGKYSITGTLTNEYITPYQLGAYDSNYIYGTRLSHILSQNICDFVFDRPYHIYGKVVIQTSKNINFKNFTLYEESIDEYTGIVFDPISRFENQIFSNFVGDFKYNVNVGLQLRQGRNTFYMNFKVLNTKTCGVWTGYFNNEGTDYMGSCRCYRFLIQNEINKYDGYEKIVKDSFGLKVNSPDSIFRDFVIVSFNTGVYAGTGIYDNFHIWGYLGNQEIEQDALNGFRVGYGAQVVLSNVELDGCSKGIVLWCVEGFSIPKIILNNGLCYYDETIKYQKKYIFFIDNDSNIDLKEEIMAYGSLLLTNSKEETELVNEGYSKHINVNIL